jgi:PAS domain S-box-containing protein
MQCAGDAIVCFDEGGIVRAWNRAAERIFGYPRAVAEGQALRTLLQVDIPELVPHSNGSRSVRVGLLCRGANGTLVDADWSFSAVIDEAGVRTATIGIAREPGAAGRGRNELAEAARAATVGEVVTAIAHQLSQPLGAVLIAAKTCLRGFERKTLNNDEIIQALTRLSADATRASDMVAKVRRLAPASPPDRRLLSVNDVIRQTLDVLQPSFHGSRIDLSMELTEVPVVAGDRVQLQQVIADLVTNALQAMSADGDGSGSLWLRSIAAGPNEVWVEVEDSGPGIPASMRAELFAPFATSRPGGLGLGLAVCKAIVEEHGGKIWAAPGSRGAKLVFSLPVPRI